MHKCKFPAEVKIAEIEAYLAGKQSMRSIARRLGISSESVQKWAAQYESMGAAAFTQTGNKHYPSELKEQAVLEYLTRNKSLWEVCKIYKIKSNTQLRNWIKKYNGHEELQASGTGGTIFMTQGRKTTFEGYQYTSRQFHNMLEKHGMTQSMSRVGKCIDNGPMEGFWGIIKRERYYGRKFSDRKQLVEMIEEYIECYNNRRLQRKLGVMTPMEKNRFYSPVA